MNIRVEYDPTFFGGDYSKVGEFVLIPLDSLDTTDDAIEEAFEKQTGLNRCHIVHYSPDELYDNDGNEISSPEE